MYPLVQARPLTALNMEPEPGQGVGAPGSLRYPVSLLGGWLSAWERSVSAQLRQE